MSREGLEVPDEGRTRASNRDREATVAALRAAYAAGRLDLGELRDRASAAYAARTWGDLRELTADLPTWLDQASDPDQPGAQAGIGPGGPSGRPFVPMGLMGAVWLAIAVAARVPAAAIPLVGLAIFALWAACWRASR
jgi:hypothetical protein